MHWYHEIHSKEKVIYLWKCTSSGGGGISRGVSKIVDIAYSASPPPKKIACQEILELVQKIQNRPFCWKIFDERFVWTINWF